MRVTEATLVVSIILLLILISFRAELSQMDNYVNSLIMQYRIPFFDQVAILISIIFDTYALTLISIFIAIILYFKGYSYDAIIFVGSMAGNAITTQIIKLYVATPRPPNMIIPESGYSFPSGHASSIIPFTIIILHIIFKGTSLRSKPLKILVGSLFLLLILIVCFDRIYLNVHWLSDVIGGVLAGLIWSSVALLLFKIVERNHRIHNLNN